MVCCPLGRVGIRPETKKSLITSIRKQPSGRFTKKRFTMFRVILASMHALLMTAVYGTTTKPDWRATSWTYPKNVTQRFIEIAGGEDALQEQISSILDRASYHNNRWPCTLDKTIEGRNTLVLRI